MRINDVAKNLSKKGFDHNTLSKVIVKNHYKKMDKESMFNNNRYIKILKLIEKITHEKKLIKDMEEKINQDISKKIYKKYGNNIDFNKVKFESFEYQKRTAIFSSCKIIVKGIHYIIKKPQLLVFDKNSFEIFINIYSVEKLSVLKFEIDDGKNRNLSISYSDIGELLIEKGVKASSITDMLIQLAYIELGGHKRYELETYNSKSLNGDSRLKMVIDYVYKKSIQYKNKNEVLNYLELLMKKEFKLKSKEKFGIELETSIHCYSLSDSGKTAYFHSGVFEYDGIEYRMTMPEAWGNFKDKNVDDLKRSRISLYCKINEY